MNGRTATRLRRQVYGKDYSPRWRDYKTRGSDGLVADERRQAFQAAKRARRARPAVGAVHPGERRRRYRIRKRARQDATRKDKK